MLFLLSHPPLQVLALLHLAKGGYLPRGEGGGGGRVKGGWAQIIPHTVYNMQVLLACLHQYNHNPRLCNRSELVLWIVKHAG